MGERIVFSIVLEHLNMSVQKNEIKPLSTNHIKKPDLKVRAKTTTLSEEITVNLYYFELVNSFLDVTIISN